MIVVNTVYQRSKVHWSATHNSDYERQILVKKADHLNQFFEDVKVDIAIVTETEQEQEQELTVYSKP